MISQMNPHVSTHIKAFITYVRFSQIKLPLKSNEIHFTLSLFLNTSETIFKSRNASLNNFYISCLILHRADLLSYFSKY